jgi:hypothetical protein
MRQRTLPRCCVLWLCPLSVLGVRGRCAGKHPVLMRALPDQMRSGCFGLTLRLAERAQQRVPPCRTGRWHVPKKGTNDEPGNIAPSELAARV